jgi:hypothetical protein
MSGPNSFIEALEQAFVTPQPAPEKARCAYCGDSDRPLMKESPHGEKICEACHQSVHPSQAQPDAVPALPKPAHKTFHGWYMGNAGVLKKKCQSQETEPPFKDEYIFAEAAWNYLLAQLQSANERAAHWARANGEKQKLFDEAIAQRDAANERAERLSEDLRKLEQYARVCASRADTAEARLAQPELKAEGELTVGDGFAQAEKWWVEEGIALCSDEMPSKELAARAFVSGAAWGYRHTKSGLGEDGK